MTKYLSLVIMFVNLCGSFSYAGEADVVEVKVYKSDKNLYSLTVTVLHKDTGWEHYANKWDILDEKGTVLGARVLHHPHVQEQPFSRSLSGVNITGSIKSITVRAHDSVHKYGGKVMNVELP